MEQQYMQFGQRHIMLHSILQKHGDQIMQTLRVRYTIHRHRLMSQLIVHTQ